mmetsp:Transcript_44154/g.112704  ORF Transcript_44154/g.112704 Transcript_44154/m.112704 type:complete len:681 (-) Transcript_44154:240-2282(-)|eukprot:jgi/Tetstr1/435161/TSEL_002617.t1
MPPHKPPLWVALVSVLLVLSTLAVEGAPSTGSGAGVLRLPQHRGDHAYGDAESDEPAPVAGSRTSLRRRGTVARSVVSRVGALPAQLGMPASELNTGEREHPPYFNAPSLAKLPDGRLIAVADLLWATGVDVVDLGGGAEKLNYNRNQTVVWVSGDRGVSWRVAGKVPRPLMWGQLLTAPSGIYLVGAAHGFVYDSPAMVSKMGDTPGEWSRPVPITRGGTYHLQNTGFVTTNDGLVVRTAEYLPSLDSNFRNVTLQSNMSLLNCSWHKPCCAKVDQFDDVAQYMTLRSGANGVFLRVRQLEVLPDGSHLLCGIPVFKHHSRQKRLIAGTILRTTGAQLYKGLFDWCTQLLYAQGTSDLSDPASWHKTRAVCNPSTLHQEAQTALLGVKSDKYGIKGVKDALKEFTPHSSEISRTVRETLGVGTPYMMEGVPTVMKDGQVLVILRLNNRHQCGLAALFRWNTTDTSPNAYRFWKLGFVPGAASAHPGIVYSPEDELYYMVNNVPTNSLNNYAEEAEDPEHKLYISKGAFCQASRNKLGLFVSSNAYDWEMADTLFHSKSLSLHSTYPHMLIDGQDLIFVTRDNLDRKRVKGNHRSSSIHFQRVRDFKHYGEQFGAETFVPSSEADESAAQEFIAQDNVAARVMRQVYGSVRDHFSPSFRVGKRPVPSAAYRVHRMVPGMR